MTVWLVDKSDFDTDRSMPTGFSGGTYKFTEGTTTVHNGGPSTLNAWRAQDHPILGAYHVLRTPGNGGNGSLSSQLDFWLSHLDAGVPWWRDVPFMLQVDAEKWSYDSVSVERPMTHAQARATLHPEYFAQILAQRASTTIDFCTLLNNNVSHGWKICYASRGQYGDSLSGISIDLWNAHYVGSYPGDNSSDFAPYSGKPPAGLQYTSTPFDQNGFPGTINDLLVKMGGNVGTPIDLDAQDQIVKGINPRQMFDDEWELLVGLFGDADSVSRFGFKNPRKEILAAIAALPGQIGVTLTADQYADLKAALLAAQPTAADLMAHFDYGAFATALASHVH